MAEGVPKTGAAAGLPKIEVGGAGLPNADEGVETAPKTDPPPKTELGCDTDMGDIAPNADAGGAAGCPNAELPNMDVPDVAPPPNTEEGAAWVPNVEGAREPKAEAVAGGV